MTGDGNAMTKIIFVEADGTRITTPATIGQSLMEAAVAAGVNGIVAECGGACVCGTCHCYVDQTWLPRIKAAEDGETDMLEFVIDPKDISRLSCQIKVSDEMDGLEVNVPESQT